MKPRRLSTPPKQRSSRALPDIGGWLMSKACFGGLTLLGLGCGQFAPSRVLSAEPAYLASLKASAQSAPTKEIAINLDTVFRLAEEQNLQVALARSRVWEACAERSLASNTWLPSFHVGTTYQRHEGGIANEDGTLTHSSFSTLFAGLELNGRLDLREAVYQKVNSERQLWQHKGELRRITTETLLDASSTYIDLLAAKTGEAIAVGMQMRVQSLLERAENLAKTEPGARVEVARIKAQLKARELLISELRQGAARGSTKLAYLLGLDPCSTLVPVDERLVPLELVNADSPVCDLVAQALAAGPGIHEMEGLLALIHDSIERSKGPGRLFPILEMHMAEGGFGTGPGARQDWDNRWDFGVAARWNLMEHLTRCDRERVIQAKTEQAHLAYQDLRAKLTAGI